MPLPHRALFVNILAELKYGFEFKKKVVDSIFESAGVGFEVPRFGSELRLHVNVWTKHCQFNQYKNAEAFSTCLLLCSWYTTLQVHNVLNLQESRLATCVVCWIKALSHLFRITFCTHLFALCCFVFLYFFPWETNKMMVKDACTLKFKHDHFTCPTSGTKQFSSQTCKLGPEQVLWTRVKYGMTFRDRPLMIWRGRGKIENETFSLST